MKETKITNFSKEVRYLLLANSKTQTWLAEQFEMTNNSIQNKLKNDSFSIAEQYYVKSILNSHSNYKPLLLTKQEFAVIVKSDNVNEYINEHGVCLTRDMKIIVSLTKEAKKVLKSLHIGDYYKGVLVTSIDLEYSVFKNSFYLFISGIYDSKSIKLAI